MTRRDTLIAAVKSALEAIAAGGQITVDGAAYAYRTSLGTVEFMRRLHPLTERETIMLAVHPGLSVRDNERSGFGVDRYRLEILIEISARGKTGADLVAAGWDDVRQTAGSLRQTLRAQRLARWCGAEPTEPTDGFKEILASQRLVGLAGLIVIEYTINAGEV